MKTDRQIFEMVKYQFASVKRAGDLGCRTDETGELSIRELKLRIETIRTELTKLDRIMQEEIEG